VLALFFARCSSTPCVAHVNITGRGSTIRKIILLTIARTLGLRYVLHVHDYDYAGYYRDRSALLKGLIATAFRRAAIIVVLGRRDQEVISQLFQLPRGRIVVLHNAVPDPLPDLRMTTPSPGRTCHLLFLGRLSARKGVPELLRALANPSMKLHRWRATLAGDGPADEFRKLAHDLGILERLCFPGWLDEAGVTALCADADVLVLPSYAEGLAMAVLEGLSHGLAVITTAVGAHTEVIEPEVSGLFVPPGDVAALADALARVVEDETLRKQLARGARDRFLAEFDVRSYASRLAQLHAGLLGFGGNEPGPIGEGQIIVKHSIDSGRDRQPAGVSSQVPRVNILGVGITPVNLAQAVATLERWHSEERREYVCCTSVHGLVEAQRDPEVRSALNRAGLATEDGMPLVWWCQRSGFRDAGRVCGSDLLEAMCEIAPRHGHRHFFYGGSARVAEKLVLRLTQLHPGLVIAGYRSPPFRSLTEVEDAADIKAINETRPDFVWVGLGMPKQEKWMAQHVGKIHAAALLGVGAAFDFFSEEKPRAPLWMQRSGVEWLFRLMIEPRRLAHRYLVDNSVFVARAIQQRAGWKSYAQDW